MKKFNEYLNEKRGLWDNIWAKRRRIARGSGEHMRKPGSKGAPTADAVKASQNEEIINERGEDSRGYKRSTESGAGLTRKGAEHFGIHTAVTTPPSKLDPNGKAAKRRKSFCARMSGMPGPMKDKKGRPTRKAMSLRRWNCHESYGDYIREALIGLARPIGRYAAQPTMHKDHETGEKKVGEYKSWVPPTGGREGKAGRETWAVQDTVNKNNKRIGANKAAAAKAARTGASSKPTSGRSGINISGSGSFIGGGAPYRRGG